MKKFTLCTTMAIMLSATAAWAAGIGVYGTGGVNLGTWRYEGASTGTTDFLYGGGIVVDSCVARDQVFGYRLYAGYSQYLLTTSEYTGKPAHRVGITNSFGVGIVRTNSIRFWGGPQIALNYIFLREDRYELDAIGLEALLAIGLNMHAGDAASFFFDIGLGYIGNYNINIAEQGHGFGVVLKAGLMFRINDRFGAEPTPAEGNPQEKKLIIEVD